LHSLQQAISAIPVNRTIEAQVDEVAAELWGITDRELKEIWRSLEELG
jgi:hypothetical protein